MSPVDIEAIRGRLAIAKQGTWTADWEDGSSAVFCDGDPFAWLSEDEAVTTEFIAHAPEDIKALLAERDEARAELERWDRGDKRWLCTNGHHVVSRLHDDLETCGAIIPWPGGEPCGAQLHRYYEFDQETLEKELAAERAALAAMTEQLKQAKDALEVVRDCTYGSAMLPSVALALNGVARHAPDALGVTHGD